MSTGGKDRESEFVNESVQSAQEKRGESVSQVIVNKIVKKGKAYWSDRMIIQRRTNLYSCSLWNNYIEDKKVNNSRNVMLRRVVGIVCTIVLKLGSAGGCGTWWEEASGGECIIS